MRDEELVRQVAQGDEQALSELYDRYSRPVYATGVRLLGDAHLAEDLGQDAFIKVWQMAASFDPSRARFATWLYQVTRNRAVDLDRRRRARPKSAGDARLQTISGGAEPEASVDGWDVVHALSRIPEEHREILTLAYFEGLSQREISRRTGIPLGTIKSQRRTGSPGRRPGFDREAYRRRNVVERCVGRLKEWRSVATRYEKRADNYRAMVVFASLMVWLPS